MTKYMNFPITLVGEPSAPGETFHFTRPCYGMCDELLHLWPALDGETLIRVRHGEGEAVRDFIPAEYHGVEFLEWVASVHRYEEGR
jgi:O-succinylbenzoate synthase